MEPFCRQGKDQYHGEPPARTALECDALFIKLHRSNFCCIFPLSDSSSINIKQAIGAKLVQRRSVTSWLGADHSQHGPAGPMSLTTNYPCLQIVFHAANLTLLLSYEHYIVRLQYHMVVHMPFMVRFCPVTDHYICP